MGGLVLLLMSQFVQLNQLAEKYYVNFSEDLGCYPSTNVKTVKKLDIIHHNSYTANNSESYLTCDDYYILSQIGAIHELYDSLEIVYNMNLGVIGKLDISDQTKGVLVEYEFYPESDWINKYIVLLIYHKDMLKSAMVLASLQDDPFGGVEIFTEFNKNCFELVVRHDSDTEFEVDDTRLRFFLSETGVLSKK